MEERLGEIIPKSSLLRIIERLESLEYKGIMSFYMVCIRDG